MKQDLRKIKLIMYLPTYKVIMMVGTHFLSDTRKVSPIWEWEAL